MAVGLNEAADAVDEPLALDEAFDEEPDEASHEVLYEARSEDFSIRYEIVHGGRKVIPGLSCGSTMAFYSSRCNYPSDCGARDDRDNEDDE